jgi:DNA topoisomerase-2
MKVVQLAGYIAENTSYHHGEASLHSTIINMAQDYVGSNNVPLLEAAGQFGTRAQVCVDRFIKIYMHMCIYMYMSIYINVYILCGV